MSKILIPIDLLFNNKFGDHNVVYYKSLPGMNNRNTEYYIQFCKNECVKRAIQINSEEMARKCIYLNCSDMKFFDVSCEEKLEIIFVPKPDVIRSVIISVTDELEDNQITDIPKKLKNKIKNMLLETVVNINNWHILHSDKIYRVKILTIIDKNKNEMKCGCVNDKTQIINICSENQIVKFNVSSLDFDKIGVGGLEKEFKQLVKNIFITRIIPKNIYDKLNIKHTKGAILYGPPGCGKTRIARQFGLLIGCKHIQIINGPELLNKYIGESEKNIRECFDKAKNNPKELHLLIFDEFDALAMKRSDSSIHHHQNQVVSQLLTMLDGVEEINNIIVFALTNRIDIIDPAILRPGRFSTHIKIDLPNVHGRYEILQIHSKNLVDNQLFHTNVDLMEIAKLADDFTGAELELLIQNTVQHVIGHQIDFNNIIESAKNIKDIQIGTEDFLHILPTIDPVHKKNKIKSKIDLETKIKKRLTKQDHLLIASVIDYFKNTSYPSVCCIEGPNKSGKTSIVCSIAKNMTVDNIEYISATTILNLGITSIKKYLKGIFENPVFSLIILDNIETIIGFVSEKFFDVQTLQIINILLSDTKHNVIITTSYCERLKNMTVLDSVQFHTKIIL